MQLYTSPTTPFGRKAMLMLLETGLAGQTTLHEVAGSPTDPGNMPVDRNPLGKIPALVLDDGSVLFDSPVICEYLDHKGGGKFFPRPTLFAEAKGKWKALVLQALGDGIAEAAVAHVMLGREPVPPEATRQRQMETILSGLDMAERALVPEAVTIGEVALACALGYVEFRLPDLDWKSSRPTLAGWYAKFCEYPSMKATAPSAP